MNSKAIRKQLLAAVAMVLVAAVALGSSTYAWFVASGEVTATGMKVQAQAETGIVISDEDHESFASVANAKDQTTKALTPASTYNGSDWWHANSDAFDSHVAATEYKAAAAGSYVTHRFYIKSASGAAYTNTIKIASVTASGDANTLSSAVRVGVKFEGDTTFYIFAPVGESVDSRAYTVHNEKTVTPLDGTVPVTTTINNLPDNSSNGKFVDITIWYEGEDKLCKSSRIPVEEVINDITVVFTGEDCDTTVQYTQPA